MSYKYFPHTEDDLQAMLQKVGVASMDDLYAEVPAGIRFQGDYQLPSEMSELEVRQLFEKLGTQNQTLTCFAGAGVYDHYTPAVIPQLLQRSEFLTSYTRSQDVGGNQDLCSFPWNPTGDDCRRERCHLESGYGSKTG